MPGRIKHTEKPFIEFEAGDLKIFWHETIKKTKENLLETLCIEICERLFTVKEKFWAELHYLEKEQEPEDWLITLILHLEGEIEWAKCRKRKSLKTLCTDVIFKQLVDKKFLEHSKLFTFFSDLQNVKFS